MQSAKIKQRWVPYWEWEDYINGMWRSLDVTDDLLNQAIEFTGDHERYGSAMREVIFAWPHTMINSLTNPSINQRAFVGHCAVCFKIGIPEYVTRMAWGRLTNEQRIEADWEATKAIKQWRIKYVHENQQLHKNVGRQMLFEWPA